MKIAALIVALAACDQPFGIHSTVLRDGAVDAPWQCPAAGGALAFSRVLHQAIVQPCSNFNSSQVTGRAIAMCNDGMQLRIFDGPIDGPLAPAGVDPESSDIDFSPARLAPEGDHMYVGSFDLTNVVGALRDYERVDGGWVRRPDLPFGQIGFTSTPSRAPERHMLFNPGSDHLEEWASIGSTWTMAQMQTYAELGIATIGTMWLSGDALHVMAAAEMAGHSGIHVIATADRATTSERFPALTARSDIVVAGDPFVTEDCTRLYLSGLDAIFYVLPQ